MRGYNIDYRPTFLEFVGRLQILGVMLGYRSSIL